MPARKAVSGRWTSTALTGKLPTEYIAEPALPQERNAGSETKRAAPRGRPRASDLAVAL